MITKSLITPKLVPNLTGSFVGESSMSVTISGYVITGQTLTATASESAGVTYQWKRGTNDISGATSSTYSVTADDEGNSITCVATKDGSSVTSNGLAHWYPGDITVDVYLDASDVGFTDSRISQWNDKSGNDRHATQNTAAEEPFNGSRSFNGLNVIDFQSSQVMEIGYDISRNQITGIDFLLAYLSDSDNTTAHAVFGNDNGGWDRLLLDSFTVSSITYALGAGTGSVQNNELAGNAFNIVHIRYDGSNSFIRQNGTELRTFTESTTGSGHTIMDVGAIGGGDYKFNGFIAEFVASDTLLTQDNYERWESYVAYKYGRESTLPTDHTYKNAPATITR